jgi:multicomponent Na+:H+ antiporter subunit F
MIVADLSKTATELAVASPSTLAAAAGLATLSVALVVCFWRLVVGPSLPDRVVALDLIAVLLVGLLVLHSVAESEPNSLRVALVLALINFLATVGFAVYVGRRVRR